jgi:S-formylglutathione hydrolase
MSFTLVSEHVCHGGVQRFYEHVSFTIGLSMRFSVFLPQACALEKVPALLYLAGPTCTEETGFLARGVLRKVPEIFAGGAAA